MTELSWRFVGFHIALDHEHRVWCVAGTQTGLLLLPALARRAARGGEGDDPMKLRPDQPFSIRVWERPGIDDQGIYGPPEDLTRLAAVLEARLADADGRGEFKIDTEYAADAEYALAVRVTSDAVPPTATVPTDVTGDLSPPQQLEDLPPLAFSFYDIEDDHESEGWFTLTEDAVVLEYRIKSEDDDVPVLEVQDRDIPVTDIASVAFKRGIIGPLVTIEVRTMRALEGLPTSSLARTTLRFKRRDRERVEHMVSLLDALLQTMK